MPKPILISGAQPTGRLHLGNYLGALKNFVDLQNSGKYQCYFFIADLHSLTEEFNPREKLRQILELTAGYLATGLNPKQSVIFQQSQIPAHSELAWILNTITPLGDLERMTQFKEKGYEKSYLQKLFKLFKKHKKEFRKQANQVIVRYYQNMISHIEEIVESGIESKLEINTGLLDYPVLMAADILIYDAEFVPVGEDQLQHLEFTCTLVRKFNKKFGRTFIEPKPILTKVPRLMSLKDPAKKMSKSQPEGCLFLDDSPKDIEAKIKAATTDSGSEIKYDQHKKPGISNLLEIYSGLTCPPPARLAKQSEAGGSLRSGVSRRGNEEISQLEKKFRGKNYSQFKTELAELIIDYFADFRKKKKELLAKPDLLEKTLRRGSGQAAQKANKKILGVKKKIGLIV